jgi:hypothetical protein
MGKLLPNNVGSADRALRILLGVVLLALAFIGPKTAWGYLGVIAIATGVMGSCPLYTLLGLSTCPFTQTRKTT